MRSVFKKKFRLDLSLALVKLASVYFSASKTVKKLHINGY